MVEEHNINVEGNTEVILKTQVAMVVGSALFSVNQ